jgi:hypothetical protein
MESGLMPLGTTLGIARITAARMETQRQIFIAVDADFNTARSAQQMAYDPFMRRMIAALAAWLTRTRSMLATLF